MMNSIPQTDEETMREDGIAMHDGLLAPYDDGHEHGDHDDHDHDDHDHHREGGPRRGTRRKLRIEEIDLTPYEECSTMYLMVCKGFTGQIYRVQVSAFDTVEESLPLIADQVDYHTSDFDKIGLYNMTRDFEYLMHETFIETGTREGDLLFMADGQACHKK